MKKLFILLVVLFVSSLVVQAEEIVFMERSETIVTSATGDIQAYTPSDRSGKGYFFGYEIDTDGTNNVTEVVMYDNTAASGTILVRDYAIPTSATNRKWAHSFGPPIPVSNGIFVTATCAGAYTITVYKRDK